MEEQQENIATTQDGKLITIKFEKIFPEATGIEVVDEFIIKKRAYQTISDLILGSINNVFAECKDDIALPYLAMSYKCKDVNEDYPFDALRNDVLDLFKIESVLKYIKKYVDANYKDEMDAKTELIKSSKKINKELQFTDQHVKIILSITEAIRISIPVISDYCERRKADVTEVAYKIFCNIIEYFQGPVNMLYKIHRFIYSRVVSTKYSDKPMWDLLESKSKDEQTITKEFLNEIIVGVLPKSIFEKNAINLFHVVVNFKLKYEFLRNHKTTYRPINFNQVDSEGLSQFDRWEIGMTKKNESRIIINRLSIKSQIPYIMNDLKLKVSKSEYEYYYNRIKFNSYQINMIFLFFSRYLGTYQNMNNCTKQQYIILVIMCYKWLKMKSLDTLAAYLIGIPDKLNEKRVTSRSSKAIDAIVNSRKYKNLIARKYNFVKDIINENHIILKMIGNISISKYNELIPYEQYDPNNPNPESKELTCKVERLAYEFLEFIEYI